MQALTDLCPRTFRLIPLTALALGTVLCAQSEDAATPTELPVPEAAPAGTSHIDQADLRSHAFYFASDELEGRYTSTPGQRKAAEYIAERFAELGLEPIGTPEADDGEQRGFFQEFPLSAIRITEGSGLRIGGVLYDRGYAILPDSRNQGCDVEGRFEFFGRGAPSQLPGPDVDLAEVIPVVAFDIESPPKVRLEAALGMAGRPLLRARGIARKVAEKGAKVLVIALQHDENPIGALMNYMGLSPQKPILAFGADTNPDVFGMLRGRNPIPIVFVDAKHSALLFDSLNVAVTEDSGRAEQVEAPETPPPGAVKLVIEQGDASAVNVVAMLRGSDPELGKEAIVYSAHMDHMGMRMDGDAFNGADDNASGSSALLEVAEAFAKGERPRRSIVFLSVAGEELGLWGSEWYASNPTWPLEQIVANVNIDMIGRVANLSGPQEVSITPSYRHGKYSSIGRRSAELAEQLGLSLTIGDMFYERSDHYNFAKRGVPVVFFCDGEHEDYHQVTDTADKLDYEKIQRITRLAYWTGFDIANADERPAELGRKPDWLEER